MQYASSFYEIRVPLFFQVLPGLRSFCMYCSVGILMVYLLHVTFFVGCLVYDQVG